MKRGCMVRPAEPTWRGRQSLSELDQINTLTHTQIIYFYRPPNTWLTPHDVVYDTLKSSLSRVLVPFYPLAGRLRQIIANDNNKPRRESSRLELDCNGDGVEFFEAELSAELAEFGDKDNNHTSNKNNYLFTPSPNYRYLFPVVDYSQPIEQIPVLFIQLTKLKCGGISLSLSFSHVVADGQSMAHFLREWARFARGTPLQTTPFHDRNALVASGTKVQIFDDHSNQLLHLPSLVEKQNKTIKRTVISLRLGKNDVEILKKLANYYNSNSSECRITTRNDKGIHRRFSRYEAVASHIWKCLSRVRKLRDEQETTNILTIDIRHRLRPAMPVGYFGNAIFDIKTTCLARELSSKPLGFGASRVRAGIEKVTSEYVLSAVDYIKSQRDLFCFRYLYSFFVESFIGNPNVAVVDWSNLPAYEMDFGWGNEIYFGPGNLEVEGDSVILRDCGGDDSLLVVLCLNVDHVEDFKKSFYKDIMNSCL
ncbi:Transferase [Trema orientale]|uniref:Transferase n=1 Tax=Trema orientale TaxID=63057 RepID=A0A2P5F3H9_TREOI|nr:Transferase [Trema orientale]